MTKQLFIIKGFNNVTVSAMLSATKIGTLTPHGTAHGRTLLNDDIKESTNMQNMFRLYGIEGGLKRMLNN